MTVKYPMVWENKDGDILVVRIKEPKNSELGEWINPYLTLIKDNDTEEIIGFDIWNFRNLIKKAEESQKEIDNMSEEEKEEIFNQVKKMLG